MYHTFEGIKSIWREDKRKELLRQFEVDNNGKGENDENNDLHDEVESERTTNSNDGVDIQLVFCLTVSRYIDPVVVMDPILTHFRSFDVDLQWDTEDRRSFKCVINYNLQDKSELSNGFEGWIQCLYGMFQPKNRSRKRGRIKRVCKKLADVILNNKDLLQNDEHSHNDDVQQRYTETFRDLLKTSRKRHNLTLLGYDDIVQMHDIIW